MLRESLEFQRVWRVAVLDQCDVAQSGLPAMLQQVDNGRDDGRYPRAGQAAGFTKAVGDVHR